MQLVDVNRAVERALTITERVVRKATRRFRFSPASGLPPAQGDPLQVEQVLINLVTSACQALTSPEAGVSVASRFLEDSREVVVEVTDEGVGTAPEDLGRVAEPFYTTRLESGGMGLGLSICDRIARNQAGGLELDSEVGKGTRVRLVLPAVGGSARA